MKITIETPNFKLPKFKRPTRKQLAITALISAVTAGGLIGIDRYHWTAKCEANRGYIRVLANRSYALAEERQPRSLFELETTKRYIHKTENSYRRVRAVLDRCRAKGL